MFGETGVKLVIHGKLFPAILPQDTYGFFLMSSHREIAFQPEALVAMLCNQAIQTGKVTFSKTEIVNGVQQIGLSLTILSPYTHYTFGKLKLLMEVVLKLKQ